MLGLSYSCELVKYHKYIKKDLKDTISIYRKAVSFICDVIFKEWDNISIIEKTKDKYNYIEKLIHETKDNKPKYKDFDLLFYKFPSYFRRDAISKSLGHISSYKSNLIKYEEKRKKAISNGLKFKEKKPTLNLEPNIMPTFIKDNMYKPFFNKENDNYIISLKIYHKNDWVYKDFCLKSKDLKYLFNFIRDIYEISNPTLEFKNNKFFIRYAIKNLKLNLKEVKPIKERIVLAIDLGVNNDAVCSVINGNGTILKRKFISLKSEKDHMYHLLNRKKKLQKISGNYKYAPLTHITTKINEISTEIENKVSNKIINFAIKKNVDVVVFEHLSTFKGKSSEKIHYWRKKAIIKKVCNKLHLYGIRYSTINPKNTSKLAFDGSGLVKRDTKNYSICTFSTGKIYNCDLSASYNIGARYFIKEYKKTMTESEWSQVIVKIPSLEKRTNSTFSSFKELLKVV